MDQNNGFTEIDVGDVHEETAKKRRRHPALAVRGGFGLRLLPEEPAPEHLIGSAWGPRVDKPPLFLIGHRIVWAIKLTSIVIFSLTAIPPPEAKWFIYLTHWGIMVVALHTLFSAALVVYVRIRGQPDHGDSLHWTFKIYWLIYNIAAPTSFLITIFYWSFLYGTGFDDAGANEHVEQDDVGNEVHEIVREDSDSSMMLNLMVHALNSITMFIEVMLLALPSRLVHVYQPTLFGIAYLIFNVIYYGAGGTDYAKNRWVYPMIDWSKPGPTSVVILMIFLLLVFMHAFIVFLAVARDHLADRFRRKPAGKEPRHRKNTPKSTQMYELKPIVVGGLPRRN